jgi:hypothetical protein
LTIRIKTPTGTVTATLADNATARDFASLLPLTLTLNDYASAERIGDLPKKLSTEGAPATGAPAVGDLAFYARWGNLAIFYKDQPPASGLIIFGSIGAGVEKLKASGPMKVTIELDAPAGR